MVKEKKGKQYPFLLAIYVQQQIIIFSISTTRLLAAWSSTCYSWNCCIKTSKQPSVAKETMYRRWYNLQSTCFKHTIYTLNVTCTITYFLKFRQRERIGWQKYIRCNHRKWCSTAPRPIAKSCSGSEACAWVKSAAEATAAGLFPAFSYYSQTAHLCLFDVTRAHTHSERERKRARQTCRPAYLFSFFLLVIHI